MMAQTNQERQEALRARRLMLGMTEVRGAYLPPELHATLKAEARRLLKRYKPPAELGHALNYYGFRCYSCTKEWEDTTPTADCPACGTTNNYCAANPEPPHGVQGTSGEKNG